MVLTATASLLPSPLGAQSEPSGPYFYFGYDFGSQRTFNPLTVLLNTGFDSFQFPNHDIRFLHYPYGLAADRVGEAMAHPFRTVSARGWGRFLRSEIFPMRFTTHDAAWVPNYSVHLIGLGMDYAALDEFYAAHSIPAPRLLAAVTALGAGVLNEMTESNGGGFPPSPGMVADIYVFNLGGVLLFSSETVRRFFGRKLLLADWSTMPAAMSDGTLQGEGQHFIMKVPLPSLERTRLFVRFGLTGMVGLTRLGANGSAWSVAVGGTGVRHSVDPDTGVESIDLDWTAGIFRDRDNSLLCSLIWARNTRTLLSLSLYPGTLPGVGRDVGLWVAVDDGGRPRIGITGGFAAGLGVGWAW